MVCQLESLEHSVEDGPDLEEERVLDWTDVDDVLLHQKSALECLEKDVEVGPEQLGVDLPKGQFFLLRLVTALPHFGH